MSIIPNVRTFTSIELQAEVKESNVVVNLKNQGTHIVILQSLILFRRFEDGSESFAHFGAGFADPLPLEKELLHRNEVTSGVIEGKSKVQRAQAMVNYIEVTGIAVSGMAEADG